MAWDFEINIKDVNVANPKKALRELKKSMKEVDNTSEKLDESVSAVASSATIAAGAFTGLAVAVVAANKFLNVSIEAYAELENRLIAVGRISGLTSEELAGLEDSFRSLAVETGVGAAEIANFAEQAARFGIKGEDDIADFAGTMARFGSIVGGVSVQTVKDFARIRNLTDGSETSYAQLANTVVALGNSFATSEQQIGRTSTRIAQDLAQFDISTDFALGLGTAMDSLGVSAERGGSAIQRLSQAILIASNQGTPAMAILANELGATVEEFDAMVQANPAGAVIELAKAGADTNTVMRSLKLNSVRTSAVFSALSKNSENTADAMRIAAENISKTNTIMSQSAIQAESLENLMKRLAEAVDQVTSSFGADATDGSKEYLNNMIQIVESFNGTNKSSKENLENITKLGEETAKWVGYLSDARAIASGGLKRALDELAPIATFIGEGLSSFDSPLRDIDPLAKAYDVLVDSASGYTDELKKQTEEQKKQDRIASGLHQKISDFSEFETGGSASTGASEKEIDRFFAKIKEVERATKRALAATTPIIEANEAAYVKFRAKLEQQAKLVGVDGVEAQFLRIEQSIKNQTDKLREAYDKQRAELVAADAPQAILDRQSDAYNKAADAVQAYADARNAALVESSQDEIENLQERLEEQNRQINDLRAGNEERLDAAPVAAITSEVDAAAFIQQINAQNKQDDRESEARKEEHKQAQDKRQETIEAIEKVETAVSDARYKTIFGGP